MDLSEYLEKLSDRIMDSCGEEHRILTEVYNEFFKFIESKSCTKCGMETRGDYLEAAKEIVCNNREAQYGSPEDNFNNIAMLWTNYLETIVTAKDVSIMMALMKIARIKTGTFKEDSWVDAIGYMACGAEIAGREANRYDSLTVQGMPGTAR